MYGQKLYIYKFNLSNVQELLDKVCYSTTDLQWQIVFSLSHYEISQSHLAFSCYLN